MSSPISTLRLTLVPGLGPVLIRRALEHFTSPDAALAASAIQWQAIRGIGPDRATAIARALPETLASAQRELDAATKLGVHLLAMSDPDYPPLLAAIQDAPPIIYIRGQLRPGDHDRFPVAIVGSRSCSHYGIEQTERFATHLAQAGLCIVSGGARGIDTAAHRAALRVRGRTIAVVGCGLAQCYPPDNRELFDQIAASGGAVVSELPLHTPPNAENFPARNRIISGLSLGVLVVEAGRKSGALITARVAAEEHNREVFALPARLDSSSAEGSLDLLKAGHGQMVTHPDDIIHALEAPARHHFNARHADRYAAQAALFDEAGTESAPASRAPNPSHASAPSRDDGLSTTQRAILEALDAPRSIDELAITLQRDASSIRADITLLEIRKRIIRRGSTFERAS